MGDVGPSAPVSVSRPPLQPGMRTMPRYSNVGTRLVLHPDPRLSRIESGRGTRAEASQSAALRRDAIAARMVIVSDLRHLEYWKISPATDRNRYSGPRSELKGIWADFFPRIARWNMRHSATPFTAPQ